MIPKATRTMSKHRCSLCGRPTTRLGTSSFYTAKGVIETEVYHCWRCNLAFRNLNYGNKQVQSHFYVASYANIDGERKWLDQRGAFYSSCQELLSKYLDDPMVKLLDVGCGLGHFLDVCWAKGWQVKRIELNEELVEWHRKTKPYPVESVDILYLAEEEAYDTVTFIDSLYYCEDVFSALCKARGLLRRGGILFLRVGNGNIWRVLYWLSQRILGRNSKIPYIIDGDAKWGFSKRSIKKLLARCSFKIIYLGGMEKSKITGQLDKYLFYKITQIIEKMSFGLISLTPGLIIIAKKQ